MSHVAHVSCDNCGRTQAFDVAVLAGWYEAEAVERDGPGHWDLCTLACLVAWAARRARPAEAAS